MRFEFLDPDPTDPDPLHAEQALLEQASAGRWLAHLWQAPVSLVVPSSYLRHAQLEAARADFAARGCPVWLRLSGGGLVPQGPGIVNLSLAYPVRGGAGTALVGSHEEVASLISEYHDLGFDEFILSGYPHLEEAYWFAEGVLPLLRKRGALAA